VETPGTTTKTKGCNLGGVRPFHNSPIRKIGAEILRSAFEILQ